MPVYWNDGTELFHYGVIGMKWGVRRYQNPDGTYTEAGLRRRAKLDRYRNKLVAKTKRKSEYAKRAAKESREHYENVKREGKGSKEYAEYVKSKMEDTSDWVEDDAKRAENAFKNMSTYNRYFGPIDWSGIQKQTVVDLMNKYESDEHEWKEISRSWMKANKALMNMEIDAVTTEKADIRFVMKNNR